MKILFLIPPPLDGKPAAERVFGCNYGIYPQDNIFMAYAAAVLKKEGYDVECMDFPILKKSREDFEKFCAHNDADVVVFYSVFLSKKTDLIARDMLRAGNGAIKFIFMSTEPTASPDDFVDRDTIVIRGEAEAVICRLATALKNGRPLNDIPAISFYDDGKTVHTKGYSTIDDLDSLPFPDRSIFKSKSYYNPKLNRQPFTTMLGSRGCSFGCYFCVPNSLSFAREIEFKRDRGGSKPPVRLRSPENIIAEFSMLAGSGYKAISFIDDQFVWGDDRTIKICEGIGKFGIEWSCLARADTLLNNKVTEAMGSSGCRFVAMGIESFNQGILDFIKKGCGKDVFYRAVENLKKAGIEIELNILIGSCPLETEETIEETFREASRLDPDYMLFSICTPFPYTVFSQEARKSGWMTKTEYEPIDAMKESFISYPHLSKKKMEDIIRKLYIRYYFNPGFLWNKGIRLRGFKDLVNKLKTAYTILR